MVIAGNNVSKLYLYMLAKVNKYGFSAASHLSFWAELKQSVVNKASVQWQPRLRACVWAKGQHFEQLLD